MSARFGRRRPPRAKEDSFPSFSDQPQHKVEAWEREFLARHCFAKERNEGAARLGHFRAGPPAMLHEGVGPGVNQGDVAVVAP